MRKDPLSTVLVKMVAIFDHQVSLVSKRLQPISKVTFYLYIFGNLFVTTMDPLGFIHS